MRRALYITQNRRGIEARRWEFEGYIAVTDALELARYGLIAVFFLCAFLFFSLFCSCIAQKPESTMFRYVPTRGYNGCVLSVHQSCQNVNVKRLGRQLVHFFISGTIRTQKQNIV